jgi:hypothetical protein
MAPEIMQALVGRLPPVQHAILQGYSRHPVVGYVFPAIRPVPSSKNTNISVKGMLYTDLTDEELIILDDYEDEDWYTRTDVHVAVEIPNDKDDHNTSPSTTFWKTQVYVWGNPPGESLDTTQDWDYHKFRTQHMASFMARDIFTSSSNGNPTDDPQDK